MLPPVYMLFAFLLFYIFFIITAPSFMRHSCKPQLGVKRSSCYWLFYAFYTLRMSDIFVHCLFYS